MLEKIVEVFEMEMATKKETMLAEVKKDFQATDFLTNTEKARITTGVMKPERAEEKALSRIEKYLAKTYRNDIDLLAELEELALAGVTVTSIDITIDWRNSAAWGKNPFAEIVVLTVDKNGETGRYEAKGTASGCGYDKKSTAVAIALRSIPAVRLPLVLKKIEAMTAGKEVKNEKLFGYGTGNGLIPTFADGVGMNSIVEVITKAMPHLKMTEKHAKTAEWYSLY